MALVGCSRVHASHSFETHLSRALQHSACCISSSLAPSTGARCSALQGVASHMATQLEMASAMPTLSCSHVATQWTWLKSTIHATTSHESLTAHCRVNSVQYMSTMLHPSSIVCERASCRSPSSIANLVYFYGYFYTKNDPNLIVKFLLCCRDNRTEWTHSLRLGCRT